MSIESDLAQLELQLAEKRKEFNQYQYDWSEALIEETRRYPPPLIIDRFGFNDETGQISFIVSEFNDRFNNLLRNLPSRAFSSGRNFIKHKDWEGFKNAWIIWLEEEEKSTKRELKVLIDEELNNKINSWKPIPDMCVSLVLHDDQSPSHIAVRLKTGYEQAALTDNLRTAKYDHKSRSMLVSLEEAEQLSAVLDWKSERQKYVVDKDPSFVSYLTRLEEPIAYDFETNRPTTDLVPLPFQIEGVKYIASKQWNGLIGDEMGLGKSPEAILSCEFLASFYHLQQPKFLIICPASLKGNWVREIKKWTGFSSYVLSGSVPQKYQIERLLKDNTRYWIINYDILSTDVEDTFLWVEVLNMTEFNCIVADEIHYAKNLDAKRSRALLHLEAPHKIGLSGTLLVNRPRELYAPIRFANKKLAGPHEDFVRFYENGRTPKNLDHLRATLSKVIIRRTKKDVLPELPPIHRIMRSYEMTKVGTDVYNEAVVGLWRALDAWDDEKDKEAITNVLTQILRLKQICAKDKVDYLADLAIEVYENNTTEHKKVLLFTQFVQAPAMVAMLQKRLGESCVYITGDVPPDDRLKIVDRFQNERDIKYIILTKAGVEGLTITAAGSAINCDLTWTPKDHTQFEGRAYGRMNDPHTIDSYYVIAEDTIEEEIWELIEKKMNLSANVLDNEDNDAEISAIAMDLIRALKAKRGSKKI